MSKWYYVSCVSFFFACVLSPIYFGAHYYLGTTWAMNAYATENYLETITWGCLVIVFLLAGIFSALMVIAERVNKGI